MENDPVGFEVVQSLWQLHSHNRTLRQHDFNPTVSFCMDVIIICVDIYFGESDKLHCCCCCCIYVYSWFGFGYLCYCIFILFVCIAETFCWISFAFVLFCSVGMCVKVCGMV